MSDFVETQLGELPTDWQVQRLGRLAAKIQDGTHFSPKSTTGPYRYITSKNIRFGKLDLSDCGWISESEHLGIYARCDVRPGDVLLTKDGANTGNAALNSLTTPFSLLSSVAFIRTDEVSSHSPFVLEYLLSPQGQQRIKDLMAGNAITRLTLAKIKEFCIPVPPIPQQRKIAKILTTVDNLIEKTEALIAKYQSVKQGLMHDLFTRGVDEHGHLRPSYAEARDLYKESELGWIPRGWEAVSLGTLYALPSRNGLYKPAKYYGSGTPMVHMPQMFRGLIVDVTDAVRVRLEEAEQRRFGLEEGDLLFARRSLTLEGAGQCSLVPDLNEPTAFESSIIRVRLDRSRAIPSYINQYLNTEFGYRNRLPFIRQVAVSGVSAEDVAWFPVACPRCLGEQTIIMERLRTADARTNRETQFLAKLRVLKTALMQDLLRGKVRVKVDEATHV